MLIFKDNKMKKLIPIIIVGNDTLQKTGVFDEREEELRRKYIDVYNDYVFKVKGIYNPNDERYIPVLEVRNSILDFLEPLIRRFASNFANKSSLSFDDYLQEMRTEAINILDKRFDMRKHIEPDNFDSPLIKISTFMTNEFLNICQKYKASNEQAYSCSTSNIKLLSKINKYLEEHPFADSDEVMNALNITKTRYYALTEIDKKAISMSNPLPNKDEKTVSDLIICNRLTPEAILEKEDKERLLQKRLKTILSDEEYLATIHYFGLFGCEKLSLIALTKVFEKQLKKSFCSERIRQFKESALLRLKSDNEALSLLYEIVEK